MQVQLPACFAPRTAVPRIVISALLVALGLAACGGSSAPPPDEAPVPAAVDDVIDSGTAPQPAPEPPVAQLPIEIATPAQPSSLVNGGASAHTKGAFGPVFPMPLIPIHMVMLPDGRVLAYGSDDKGVQGAALHYMVYDPDAAGYPFLVLPNTAQTDVFCSSQVLLPQDGRVMLTGGDRSVNGVRNYGIAEVTVFDPATGTMALQPRSMSFRRWYATSVITAQGEHLVLGGRDDRRIDGVSTETLSTTPEVYDAANGWRTLPGARSEAAFGEGNKNWWYPQAWAGPHGRIAVLAHSGSIFQVDPAGRGSITPWPAASGRLLEASENQPSVMFQPGRILAARQGNRAQVIDINGPSPTVRDTASLHSRRIWGSMTLLPDGQVWANGGSARGVNELGGEVYTSELWNPADGRWTVTASAVRPRLYHGNAILLRDGRVLTGGGGAPGPVAGLDGEIFYPPYLFRKDGSGQLANRPVVTAISAREMTWAAPFTMRMSSADAVRRVVMLRTGSATHAFNGEQRLIELVVTQNGRDLALVTPAGRNVAPPGYYMVFVLDANGVPAVAEIVRLG